MRGATICCSRISSARVISIHAPRAGCDDLGCVVKIFVVGISIHAPRAGCDDRRTHVSAATLISIHAPRAGCDRGAPYQRCRRARFQSTHPVRGATSADSRPVTSAAIFQSTHPVRGATTVQLGLICRRHISIHAPRAGCDSSLCGSVSPSKNFNPRTPCGVRQVPCVADANRTLFQSTHPVRGATPVDLFPRDPPAPISIHAPRAGCDALLAEHLTGAGQISIHAPRAGCDVMAKYGDFSGYAFQSTHPVRGATRGGRQL